MTRGEHQKRHQMLHDHLDELLADFIEHTGNMPSRATLGAFLNWSYEQTLNPVPVQSQQHDPEPNANPKP